MTAAKPMTCARVLQKVGAFIDGELRGPDVLGLSRHLTACPSCAEEARTIRALGEILRGAAAARPVPMEDLSGLADGVVSRVRAEEQQSWPARCGRALDDCHWLLVGVGSASAALVSALLVCAMLQVGIPERDDSLAALVGGLSPSMDVATAAMTVPEGTVARATVTRYGRVTGLQLMSSWGTPRDDRMLDGELRDFRPKLGLWSDGPQETRTVWIVKTIVRRDLRGMLE
jgi:anti-sigma factor RsiW